MQPPRSKRGSVHALSPTAPPAAMSRARRWLFRLAAMVLGPLLCVLTLEAGLRLAGVGHSMSFFLPRQVDGKECLTENNRYGWRFFGPDMARAPFPFVIPKVKPFDTTRVFVFGESAAYGDPQPEFGLSRVLMALLEGRYPGQHFEVVNTAMTAINSHVILPIAKDCAAQHGDFWVIYMGNNEVVGPYGSGTVFGPQAANLALVRAGVAFKATRVGQALGGLVRRAQKRPVNQSEWGGMVMFARHHVRQDDPRMATVYHSFERNLQDIIDVGRGAGAKIVVSTAARNLRDCGPFASDHRPGLSTAEVAQWEGLFQAGIQAQQAGRAAEALADFQQASKIDDSFAEAHFRWGQCALALGREAEAARQFDFACAQDTLRFRADDLINQIIRRTASNRQRDGVRLVDAAALMDAQSPHGLTGDEFLYEHVHLNFEGNYLVARAVAEQIALDLPAGSAQPWPSEADCAHRLGWNDWTRRAAQMDILARLNDPPFNEQANIHEKYRRLLQQIQRLDSAALPAALLQERAGAKSAVDAWPGDWMLQENLANLQRQTGDIAGAVESLRHVAKLLPQNADAWQGLGLALATASRDAEAQSAFEEAARLRPESVVSLNSLAEMYEREGHAAEAARAFREVLRRKPYWGPAHLGLGKALETLGQKEEAEAEFHEAFVNRINSPESYNALAQFAFSKGWYAASVTNFMDALRLYPGDPKTHVNLGLALEKLGHFSEAKAHFAEAIQLQPNFAEAHFSLGRELGQNGDAAGAGEEFAKAVQLKPDLIEARLNLGIALANQHLNPQALEQFDEVLRRDPGNKVALAYVNMLRARPAGSSANP